MSFFGSLRAERARAVTDRQCPYNGEGEDFLVPFYENGHNSGAKSRKIDVKQTTRLEILCLFYACYGKKNIFKDTTNPQSPLSIKILKLTH